MLLKNHVKFDLRQWVLVTSFEPLKIYIFEESYARYCSKEFDLKQENWKDSFVHLTNYSIQRKSKENENFVLQERHVFE